MRILEKYVITGFISAFFFCITLLIVLAIIGDILGFLDDIFKHNIPLSSILAFYFYLAPFAFVNMVPFAALLSSVYVFNSLSKNREITAIIASGLSLWRLLRPVMFVTFLFCMVTFIVNDRVVPSTMRKASQIRKDELEQPKEGEKAGAITDLTMYGKGDQIIYAQSFVPKEKAFYNMIIQKQDKRRVITEKISARRVAWHETKGWIGTDVISFAVDPDGSFSGEPEISKKIKLSIEEKPEDFINNQYDSKFMSYSQLKRYLKMFKISSPSAVKRLLVDLHYKLSFPFTALITVLVGVPFSVETGRSSALIGMARGVMVAMLYLPVMAVSLALGKGGTLPPVFAAWMSNILFAFVGIYWVNRKS